MTDIITTHVDEGFNDRVAAIANRIAFGADVDGFDVFEVVAARMILADREAE